jgi:hypothetical protein
MRTTPARQRYFALSVFANKREKTQANTTAGRECRARAAPITGQRT